MEFLSWHYTKGIEFYLNSWILQLIWVNHYFSPILLLRTLFAPWRRMVVVDKKSGFDFQRFFEVVSFNLISRGIGAIVRFVLFWIALVLLVLTFFGGIVGFVFWILVPIFGLPVFKRVKKNPKEVMQDLFYRIKSLKQDPMEIIFSSEAGIYLLKHLGVDKNLMAQNANLSGIDFSKPAPKSLEELFNYFLKESVWNSEFLRKSGLNKEDIITGAKMWDEKAEMESYLGDANLGRPSIATHLIFGYTPVLDQYSVDLSSPKPFSHRLIGREQLVSRMERVLSSGSSVILIGQPGVGKKTVVLEFAHRAIVGKLGKKMAFKRVLEFDYNSFLSGLKDLNEKKARLSSILEEASYAGNIILVIRDIQKLTNSQVEGLDFTDIFETHLEKGELKIIAVTTNVEYERFLVPNLRLRKYFETVEVVPPNKEETMQILTEAVLNWERSKNVTFLIPALRKLIDESDRYITETPFPEKVLELLDEVVSFVDKEGKFLVTFDEINAVLAEKTGISFASLTERQKEKLRKLEAIIHERLVNQDNAVKLIARSLRAKTVGPTENARPIGSFLFLGPTGVGKTETAKVLAKVYYGSEENILRFDMAEYAGREGLENLIGSSERNLPGRLTTAIKNKPASLLLLDEIEKAPPEIFNLFLTLLDEGIMTDAFGKRINGKNLFIIGTSNAGAEFVRKLVQRGVKGNKLQEQVLEHVLENKIFTPEFLNRFDGVVVYEPLGNDELVKVSELMLGNLAKKLENKGIYLTVDRETVKKLAEDGFDPAFGARPMRRIVDLIMGDLIAAAILREEIKDGDRIVILPGTKKEEYFIKKLG